MQANLESCKRIVIIGGGFIGAELSDELNKKGKEVTIVEILPLFSPPLLRKPGSVPQD
jgi:pyruvate/2-oxoglutarate dehydrogenase complex dihydrolipoamide dehydrogenase (E3) component